MTQQRKNVWIVRVERDRQFQQRDAFIQVTFVFGTSSMRLRVMAGIQPVESLHKGGPV